MATNNIEKVCDSNDKEVKLVIGAKEYKIDDKFLEECVKEMDNDGIDTVTKDKYAKIGLKAFSDVFIENQTLKQKVDDLTKAGFDATTREILLQQELEMLKKSTDEKLATPSPIPIDQYNAIMKKLENIENGNSEMKPKLNDIQENSKKNNANIEKLTEVVGNRKKEKNLSCRVKILRDFENSGYSITLFGTNSALKNLNTMFGDVQRDIETLKKKNNLVIEQTDKAGIDNLVQLVSDMNVVKKDKSVAVIILNFPAETAECLLDDDTMVSNYVSSAKSYVPKMIDILKSKYEKVVIILPPSTPNSFKMNTAVANQLDAVQKFQENDNAILDMTKLQEDLGTEIEEDEEVWSVDSGEKMLKKFSMEAGGNKEGYNLFATNCVISKVVQIVLGVNEGCCKNCGIDHDVNGGCFSEVEKQQETRTQESGGRIGNRASGQDSEECLKCFRGHATTNCLVRVDLKCSFFGCGGLGHQKCVHYPKKEDTADRLKELYGSAFVVVANNARKRMNSQPGSAMRFKRDRQDGRI